MGLLKLKKDYTMSQMVNCLSQSEFAWTLHKQNDGSHNFFVCCECNPIIIYSFWLHLDDESKALKKKNTYPTFENVKFRKETD